MDGRRRLADYLAQLGRQLGFACELGSDGACMLELADESVCMVVGYDNSLWVSWVAPLIAARDPDRMERLETALKLNFDASRTAGFTIALEPRAANLVLTHHREIESLSYPAFSELTGLFIHTAGELREVLRQSGETAESAAPPLNFTPLFRV